MKKITSFILASFILTFVFGSVVAGTSQTKAFDMFAVEAREIEYELPYAGILPDSPLYIIKSFRDGMWLFLTRDHLKRAELHLLLTDKKLVMAQQLADKREWDLVVDTLSKSEEHYEKIFDTLELSTQIGVSPSEDFLSNTILSSEKHKEVMMGLLRQAPQSAQEDLEEIIETNIVHYNSLNSL